MRISKSWTVILVGIFTMCTVSLLVHYTDRIAVIAKSRKSSTSKGLAEKNAAFNVQLLRDTMTITRTVHCDEITVIRSHHTDAGGLLGKILVDMDSSEKNYWNELGEDYPVNPSSTYLGSFINKFNVTSDSVAVIHGPRSSARVQRIAVIIPFRDRESHLRIFLGHTIPVLRRQGNAFSIFVVEQIGNDTFNKGRIMNSGFKHARAVGNKVNVTFDCFIFHDVDMLVESDNLLYRCSKGDIVDHLSTSVSKFEYDPLCCGMTVGGVLAMTSDQYEKVNGFPNNFWGWGGEDDALNERIKKKGLRISRPNPELGRFTMITHGVDKLNPRNSGRIQALKKSTEALDVDGLTSLNTEIEEVQMYSTFVKVRINVGHQQ